MAIREVFLAVFGPLWFLSAKISVCVCVCMNTCCVSLSTVTCLGGFNCSFKLAGHTHMHG